MNKRPADITAQEFLMQLLMGMKDSGSPHIIINTTNERGDTMQLLVSILSVNNEEIDYDDYDTSETIQ